MSSHLVKRMDAVWTKNLILGYDISSYRVILAVARLRGALAKANFNPSQPRAPEGSTDGGRWTDGGALSASRTGGIGTRLGQKVKPHVLSGENLRRNIAVSAEPLRPRSGNSAAAQVSGAVNEITSGRSTSVTRTFDTASIAGNAAVKITRQQNDQVVVDLSTKLTSFRATGTLSSEPGKTTITNFNLAAPGILNPARVVSAPSQVTIFDASDGSLRIQIDKPLTIKDIFGRTVVDRAPGAYIIPDAR